MNNHETAIIGTRFGKGSSDYDAHTPAQKHAAQRLVEWAFAADEVFRPKRILIIGCGTGHDTQAVHARRPEAHITALDIAPEMVAATKKKVPSAETIVDDALDIKLPTRSYDLVLSNYMLQWSVTPRQTLQHWQSFVAQNGQMFVALPIEGTHKEWDSHCQKNRAAQGSRVFPPAHFADGIASATKNESITVEYPTARDFVNYMKIIGAGTPRAGYKPLPPKQMLALVESAARPFPVTNNILFIRANAA